MEMQPPRAIHEIAKEILQVWKTIPFSATVYVRIMRELCSVNDMYIADTAEDIILRFLANAGTWRGDDARRIKAELCVLLKGVKK